PVSEAAKQSPTAPASALCRRPTVSVGQPLSDNGRKSPPESAGNSSAHHLAERWCPACISHPADLWQVGCVPECRCPRVRKTECPAPRSHGHTGCNVAGWSETAPFATPV